VVCSTLRIKKLISLVAYTGYFLNYVSNTVGLADYPGGYSGMSQPG
jgi:hypothetical protein